MTFSPKRHSAGAQKAREDLRFGAPVAAGGARRLGADHRATGHPQGGVPGGADVAAERTAFAEAVKTIAPENPVFLDETGASTKLTRLCARAPRGRRLFARAPFGHWKTTTFVAALRREVLADYRKILQRIFAPQPIMRGCKRWPRCSTAFCSTTAGRQDGAGSRVFRSTTRPCCGGS